TIQNTISEIVPGSRVSVNIHIIPPSMNNDLYRIEYAKILVGMNNDIKLTVINFRVIVSVCPRFRDYLQLS
ncbi:hypothetical protein COL63_29645, partial [Bacillus pseudomycoides]